MATNNFLNNAIAEAKQIKSAALASAKISLEEAFQPTLQRMISSKLSEEEGEDDEYAMEGEDEFSVDINSGEEEDFAAEEGGEGFGSFEDEPVAPEEENSEMELEALIRELDGEPEGTDEFSMDESDCEDDMYSEGMEDEVMSDNPGVDDEELSEALNALFEEEGLGDDLDMGPNKEDGAAFTDHSMPAGPQFLEARKLRNENKKLKKERNEAFQAVTILKKTLNEVNLLNAKLMFTTRTFKQFELNESQQSRILDSFDRANNVREVKLVYTTICESFNKKPLKAKVQEGFASKSTRSVNPVKRSNPSQQIISESFVKKMQRLANINRFEDED